MGHHQLDELDYKILKLIAANARIPFLEVARECNVSGAAIHQRVQKLTNLGILKGSEFIMDSNKIGFETCAYMGFYLKTRAISRMWSKSFAKFPRWSSAISRRGNTICSSSCLPATISTCSKSFTPSCSR